MCNHKLLVLLIFLCVFVGALFTSLADMSTKADLEVMVGALRQKMQEAETKLQDTRTKLQDTTAKLEETEKELDESKAKLEEKAPRTPIYMTKDRKFDKFDGTGNFQEWSDELFTYIDSRFKDKESYKINFISEHLSGRAKREVKFRLDLNSTTVDDIYSVLNSVFGVRESVTQLLQVFFGRNQTTSENTEDYAYALMEIMTKLRCKDKKRFADSDEMMKEKFADGLTDVSLRRELKRLNMERPDLKFYELRDRARRWLDEDVSASKPGTSTVSPKQSTTNQIDMQRLMEHQLESLLDKQCHLLPSTTESQVNDTDQAMTETDLAHEVQKFFRKNTSYSKPKQFEHRPWNSSNPQKFTNVQTPPVQPNIEPKEQLCHYCHLPNHFAKNCRKQLQDINARKAAYKQENETEVATEESLNEEGPA